MKTKYIPLHIRLTLCNIKIYSLNSFILFNLAREKFEVVDACHHCTKEEIFGHNPVVCVAKGTSAVYYKFAIFIHIHNAF